MRMLQRGHGGVSVHGELRHQCWGFMLGSLFFTVGAAPGFAKPAGASMANALFFTGALFFTAAACIQLMLSEDARVRHLSVPGVRAEWLAAAAQLVGALLFNVSTSAALRVHHPVADERALVWTPDAAGSVAFLVSGALVLVVARDAGTIRAMRTRACYAVWLNFIGCLAFAASAVGAFVTASDVPEDASVATMGTFAGALCFFASAWLSLPGREARPIGEGHTVRR
ncbi:hypothetical protein ONR57_03960 [Hoyosella sp. YIM 151337]|uniref:hypothetical protein n=1 Tax=Hoyosella sp. YIM 151337 TaxID=2992742 RepID=UPI00223545BE|nr:hypothetical protein [Hoyosella sp. YIM 151337]MCW4352454.1 hypothetical protein [Hoyosella sp. YIM 151337]